MCGEGGGVCGEVSHVLRGSDSEVVGRQCQLLRNGEFEDSQSAPSVHTRGVARAAEKGGRRRLGPCGNGGRIWQCGNGGGMWHSVGKLVLGSGKRRRRGDGRREGRGRGRGCRYGGVRSHSHHRGHRYGVHRGHRCGVHRGHRGRECGVCVCESVEEDGDDRLTVAEAQHHSRSALREMGGRRDHALAVEKRARVVG